MMRCSGSSLVAIFVIAVCMSGQARAQTTTSCDDPLCLSCEASNTAFCLQCDADAGYALQDSTSGVCAPCDSTCFTCTPTVSTCTECNLSGQGPVLTPSENGACAACGGNCTICDTAGAGKCDTNGCNPKFAYSNISNTCEHCPGANCPGCTDPTVCPTCQDGYGLDPPNNMDVKTDCQKCTVLHADQCTDDYQGVDTCIPNYGVDSTNTQCYPICAIIPRSEWFKTSAPPVKGNPFPSLPNRIIIHEAKTRACKDYYDCLDVVNGIYKVQTTPRSYRNFVLNEIAYNLLIGGDGSVFEGTGLTIIGSHTNKYQNPISLGVAFIGSFATTEPTTAALAALGRIVSSLCLTQGDPYLTTNFIMHTHWDVDCSLCPPGKLRNAIMTNGNFTSLYRSSNIEVNCKASGGRRWKHTL